MSREYFIVEAFATEPGTGNPAAVVLDADGLSDAHMQQIAARFNLSETTFVLPSSRSATDRPSTHDPPGDAATERAGGSRPSVRFRWFTPTVEVAMCGHATVAGVHALGQSGRLLLPDDAESVGIEIETRSGVLQAFVERVPNAPDERMIWLELMDPKLTPCEIDFTELALRLGMSSDAFDGNLPPVTTQDRDVLVFVKGFQQLNEAQPNFASLGEYMSAMGWRGMSLATVGTLTPSLSVQSRFFAPAVGIDEDPVTGSVHGPLAAYLVQQARVPVHDGTAGLMCSQGIPGGRVGLLYALVQPIRGAFSVRIGGKALTVERGALDE